MEPLIFSGSANRALAEAVAVHVGVPLGNCDLYAFPDGELHVEIRESVRGRDVYLIQSSSPPAERHLLELLLLADACQRGGSGHLTALIPYFGYARQDRRAKGREAVGGRLVATLIEAGGLQRVIAVDLHTPAVEGFFTTSMEHLTAVPLLADAVRVRWLCVFGSLSGRMCGGVGTYSLSTYSDHISRRSLGSSCLTSLISPDVT